MKGHIEQRGERSVRITVYTGKDPKTGKKKPPYHETVQGRTLAKAQKAAQIRLNHILDEMNQGKWVEPAKETFGQYLSGRWLPQVRPPEVEQSTYDMYEYLCRVHIIPGLGHIPLQKLTPMALDAFYSDRLRTPKAKGGKGTISAATVKHMHDVIHIALNQALKWNLVARNVAEAASPPSVRKKKPMAWDEIEASKFLEAMKGDPYHAAFRLGLQAGLRRGEILGLRWKDINFAEGTAKIEQTVVKTSKGTVLKAPKTKDSQGLVALSEETLDALRERRLAQAKARKAYEEVYGPGSYQDGDLVFAREDGHFLNPDAFDRYFKRRVKEVGVTPMRVHDQRHTAATLMANAGVDIKSVSDQLRHARISTTAEMYVGPIPVAQRKAAQVMDTILKAKDQDENAGFPKDSQKGLQ